MISSTVCSRRQSCRSSKLFFNVSVCSFLLLGSLLYVVESAPPKKVIPWKQCKQSDPNFQQCFSNELQSAIPQLSDGYPKFRIPSLDPFDLPSLDIAKGEGAVSVDLGLQNLKIYGLTSAIIDKYHVDVKNLITSMKLTFAQPIVLIGQYTAKGKVQVLPINGKGPCNITFVDTTIEISDMKGETVQKNGQEHIVIKDLNLKCTRLGKLSLRLDNLFQGNKDLSDNLNVFLNENWQLLYDELKPGFEEAIRLIVLDITNKVFARIDKKQIFPE